MTKGFVSDDRTFSEAVAAFGTGEDSPRDFVERCIGRIEAAEETINAFVQVDIEGARKAADESTRRYRNGRALSPIDGMPIGVKDIIDTADMPTQMNSDIYAGHQPGQDAACVRAIREGGGIIVGKTVTTEFAIGRSGPTVNPHNIAHTPGGSSSGSSAGTAAGMISAGLGTQTRGSIVRPASFNGIVGFKPTLGMLSTNGVHPLSTSHDHLGVLADSVDDAWSLSRWLSERAVGQDSPGLSGPLNGSVPGTPLSRIAVLRTRGLEEMDDGSARAFDGALERLRHRDVATIEPANDPGLADLVDLFDQVPGVSTDMVAYDMRWPFLGYMARHADKLGPRIHQLMARAQEMTRDDYRRMLAFRIHLRQRVMALADHYDAFVLPASSGPAPEGFQYTGARTLLLYWTLLGFPAMSLPVMRVDDMPFGLQLAGFQGADYRLMRQAKWIMGALGKA